MYFKHCLYGRVVLRIFFGTLSLLLTCMSLPAFAAGSLVISEFRLRGTGAAQDEFIEIYNDSGADHTVASISGTGYGIAASDGTTRCSIPNGTVIPARGHYLCVNSATYSLASYPAGNGTTATGDATYTTDIPDNAGIALFNNNTGGGSYSLPNRFDAVGSTSEANTLYKEGTGYPALNASFSTDFALFRDECGKGGSITTFGLCTILTPKDTDNNAADFVYVDTNGTSSGGMQRLGAPGPQNLSSPVSVGSTISVSLLDATVGPYSPPNYVRDFTADAPNNSTFGTDSIRRRIVNNTGGSLTRLRYRIVDLTTFPAPSGFADWRPRTSVAVVVAGINDSTTCAATGSPAAPPCTTTVQGSTLEQPPSQPNGSGFNGSLSSGTVTLATPLGNGASINVQFLMGIQQTGNAKLGLIIEALPGGGGSMYVQCGTDGCTIPAVSSIVRADPNPTSAATVDFTVTFNQIVTGVDTPDFALTTSGVSGASITNVSGSGASYTVTVNTGTGNGTIRLDVADNDSIISNVAPPSGGALPLGNFGAANGNFTSGQVYTVDKSAVCGNSVTEAGEQCDDGNVADGDCCSSTCQFEGSGSPCDDGNSCTAVDTCDGAGLCTGSGSTCGNGSTEGGCGEQCDDGGLVNGDGCSSTCQTEFCGDGSINNNAVPGTEECDNGIFNSDTTPDACRTNCKNPRCGDGVIDTGEECDDGNTTDGDGCSTTCQNESSQTTVGGGGGTTPTTPTTLTTNGTLGGGGGCNLRQDEMPSDLSQVFFSFLFLLGILTLCRRGGTEQNVKRNASV